MTRLQKLKSLLESRCALYDELIEDRGQLTVELGPDKYIDALKAFKSDPELDFALAADLCGVDYLNYAERPWPGKRFAVVAHLLSLSKNWRLRVRCFCDDDDFPAVATATTVYESLGWDERECFDMFGIAFTGHPDLRRILTDYGFVGHPLRKDFPVSGYAEMVYDPKQRRVVYQPVSIEPRINIPRVVREDSYSALDYNVPPIERQSSEQIAKKLAAEREGASDAGKEGAQNG